MVNTGTVYIDHKSKSVGKKEQAKNEIKKLDKLVKGTQKTIYELSSIFPFQIFPDKIIIDENKVSIVRKQILFKRIFTIFIKDIRTVKVNRGILFAAMEFEIKGYETNPGPTTYLWPYEATKAKQLILGLMGANKEKVDLSKIPPEKAKEKLQEIGKAADDTSSLF